MHTNRRSGERGFALFGVLMLMMLALTLGASALLYSAIELKTAQNYKNGMMAFAAAESGATHALTRINKRMVQHFQNDIVNAWNTHPFLLGTDSYEMDANANMEYGARTRAWSSNTRDVGFIFSRGWGPGGSVRTVTLRVVRSPVPQGIGAIFAMNENYPSGAFNNNGNRVLVDGNNNSMSMTIPNGNGSMCTGVVAGGGSVPAINTQNEASMNNLADSLTSDRERGNYRGLGEENCRGSGNNVQCDRAAILPMGGPRPQDLDTIINNLTAGMGTCTQAQVPVTGHGNNQTANPPSNCVYRPDNTFGNNLHGSIGTSSSPGIVHFTEQNSPGGINGNFDGYGVMIIDGDVRINGNMRFGGLIIVRGNLTITGNASIAGSVWFTGDSLTVGGSADVCYSSQALAVADNVGIPVSGGPPRNLPTIMTVAQWMEGLPDDASDILGGIPDITRE